MRNRRLRALVVALALALLAIAALRDIGRLGDALPWRQLYDFQDFYCAGSAVAQGADPYRYEPLRTCEHRVNETAAYRRDARRVVPAPLPPYDFPPLALAARLGFPAARTLFALAIVAAVLAAIWGLSLLAIPLDLAALALALPAGFLLLSAGQVVPFALAAIVFCGVALARRRDGVAGILAGVTLIEPHLGLPICAALLVCVPRSRIALVATGAVLCAAAFATVGIGGVVEYLARVLPAQAAAESGYVYQYSLTYLLVTLGSPAPIALLLGDASYVAMVVLSVWLSARLRERLGRPELLAFVPAALSLAGGPYVHMVDLAVAVPAALVLVTCLSGAPRNAAAVALVLLAVPWIDVWITKKLFLASLFVVAAILLRLQINAALSIGVFSSLTAFVYVMELWPPAALVAVTARSFAAGDLAQDAWRAYVTQLGKASPLWLVIKLPTWGALASLLGASLAAIRGGRPRTTP